jgi:hypothetical protein
MVGSRTVREPIARTIERLEAFVSRMERRYECTSPAMEAEVQAGHARETAEVGRWLGEYRALVELQAVAHGPAAGSRTTPTS